MKKKIIAVVALAFLIVGVALSGTVAYLTDTDYKKNTMAVGSIKLEQSEWQRAYGSDGAFAGFEAFSDGKSLVPAVYKSTDAATAVSYGDLVSESGASDNFWDPASGVYNAHDKIITVKNTGKNPFYFRTLIAVESVHGLSADKDGEIIINTTADSSYKVTTSPVASDVDLFGDGTLYDIYYAVYLDALKAGETCRPAFMQFMLAGETTQETIEGFGQTLEIYALSQAVQAEGFTDAAKALDQAFGAVDAAGAKSWFANAK